MVYDDINPNMNTNPPDLQTTSKLLKVRSILEKISQTSWSFSVLNKKYPIAGLNQSEADALIATYTDLIQGVSNFLKSEYEQNGKTV